ncbi:MAG: UDP-2,3-diacylglucosamine diphosphatase [Methylophilaceae bacterium]
MHKVGDFVAKHSIFISDLHLCVSRPHITAAFLQFLQHTASKAEALYILGDLFEYWAGDDDIEDVHHHAIITSFKALAESGVQLFLMHGNRDFLISTNFCNTAHITLLPDPSMIDLYGTKTLLSHGDMLCTDDVAYIEFRQQVRNDAWQTVFLSQPLQVRKKAIEDIRSRSEQEKAIKSSQIMDVNAQAVANLIKIHGFPPLFIHGHTHRPNQHLLAVDGHRITRWVLGDWYEQGSYLKCDKNGCTSEPI